MSKDDKFNKALKEDLDKVKDESLKPGSPALERYLAAGYPRIKNRKHATDIVQKYEAGSTLYPYEVYEDALAFLEALDAKPTAKDIYHPPTNFRGEVVAASSPDAL
jgi:hypothetical protein